jgi:hypothetical protein
MISTGTAEYEGYGFLLSDYWGFELDEEEIVVTESNETPVTSFNQATASTSLVNTASH